MFNDKEVAGHMLRMSHLVISLLYAHDYKYDGPSWEQPLAAAKLALR
jgi:hypothetical protein